MDQFIDYSTSRIFTFHLPVKQSLYLRGTLGDAMQFIRIFHGVKFVSIYDVSTEPFT